MWKPIIITIAALGLFSSCKKDDAAKEQPAKTAKSANGDKAPTKVETKPEAKPAEPSEADLQAALAVMAPYETCREALAADKSDIAACANQIAEAAGKAKAGVASQSMKEIESAAKALASTPSDDIGKLRLAFGDVSKPVETMLTAIPKAAAKYKMFECPMAKGFKRWAQPTGDKVAMANPYMGTKMLECGSEVHDHHMGSMKDKGDMKHGDMKHGDMKHGDMKHGDK